MGLAHGEFWNLTPGEFAERALALGEHMRHTAWLRESLARQKKLPSHKRFVRGEPLSRKVQGEEAAQLRAQHNALCKAIGASDG